MIKLINKIQAYYFIEKGIKPTKGDAEFLEEILKTLTKTPPLTRE